MDANNYSENQKHLQSMRPAGTVSVGNWFVTLLLMAIPLVNLIMLFVWAFGGGANPSKANWAKASLIWMLIGIALTVIFWSTFAALFVGMGGLSGL